MRIPPDPLSRGTSALPAGLVVLIAVAAGAAAALAPMAAVGGLLGLAFLGAMPPVVAFTLVATMAWPIAFLPAGYGGIASAGLGLAAMASFLLHAKARTWHEIGVTLRARLWPVAVAVSLALYLTVGAYWSESSDNWVRLVLLWSLSVPAFFFAYTQRESPLMMGVVIAGIPVVVGLFILGSRPYGMNPISALVIAASVVLAAASLLLKRPPLALAVLGLGAVMILTGSKTGPKIAFGVALLHFFWAAAVSGNLGLTSSKVGRRIALFLGYLSGILAIFLGLREAYSRLFSSEIVESRSVIYRRDLWLEGLASTDPLGSGLVAGTERHHNVLVEAWASSGIAGLILTLALIIGAAVAVVKRRSTSDSFLIPYIVLWFSSGGIAESWPMWFALGWLLSPRHIGTGRGSEGGAAPSSSDVTMSSSPIGGRASMS